MTFDRDVLTLDIAATVAEIERTIIRATTRTLHRRGVVVGLSGGVDSSVCAALAVRALGPERVVALLMPDWESDSSGTANAHELCRTLGLTAVVEPIGPALEALGCYRRRDDAIRELFPEFGACYRQKITIAGSLLESDRINYFDLTIESPAGERAIARMPASVYSRVVAATNMKQRTRKMIEYSYADARNFAVLGTPNRLEYVLGFFVRGGDGLADIKPIAHLYKTQVYELARFLHVPEVICSQAPTTDTYTLPQTQEEFYFAVPYHEMDLLLWAWEHAVTPEAAGQVLGLGREAVTRVYRDVEAKRRAAARALRQSVLVEPVDTGDDEIPS